MTKGTTIDATSTPAEEGAPEYTEPAWLTALTPDIVSYYRKVLGDADYAFPIPKKNLEAAINTLGSTVLDEVMTAVKEPYDIFKIPMADYIRQIYESINSYGDQLSKMKLPDIERKAFKGYEGELRGHLSAMAKGRSFTYEEMQSQFRQQITGITTTYKANLAAINRLAAGDPRLRKSVLIDLEIAKGAQMADARDKVNARAAEVRLQSEFAGAQGLLDLSRLAISEEQGYNAQVMERALQQINIQTQAQNIKKTAADELLNLGIAEMDQKARGEMLRQERQQAVLGAMGMASSLYQFGQEFPLRAATGATSLAAAGMSAAIGRYQADISRYSGKSYNYMPGFSFLSAGMGAGGGALAGAVAGSLIPDVGTLAGAVIGGAGGLALSQ